MTLATIVLMSNKIQKIFTLMSFFCNAFLQQHTFENLNVRPWVIECCIHLHFHGRTINGFGEHFVFGFLEI